MKHKILIVIGLTILGVIILGSRQSNTESKNIIEVKTTEHTNIDELPNNLVELNKSLASDITPNIITDTREFLDYWSAIYIENVCRELVEKHNDNGPFIVDANIEYIEECDVDRFNVYITSELHKYKVFLNIMDDMYTYEIIE